MIDTLLVPIILDKRKVEIIRGRLAPPFRYDAQGPVIKG
jgi:hypothetical protein